MDQDNRLLKSVLFYVCISFSISSRDRNKPSILGYFLTYCLILIFNFFLFTKKATIELLINTEVSYPGNKQ